MKIDAVAQDESPVTRAAARTEFHAEVTYLDTASFGLPPRRSWMVRQHALAQWRAGIADPVAYDLPLAAARSSYAHLAGMDPSLVAMGSQVSVFARLIAADLPDDSEVLTATGDFTSILFPFYAQSGRGICIRGVPLERIAECVTSATTLIAVSAVQSADGRVAAAPALRLLAQVCTQSLHRHALGLANRFRAGMAWRQQTPRSYYLPPAAPPRTP
jgi:selenocysteine lyase/cysteine desulfurase